MQALLPLFGADTEMITPTLGYQQKDGTVYYFHAGLPVFHHAAEDRDSFRMIASQFYLNGLCKQSELVRAFGVPAIMLKRAVKQYLERGPASFYRHDKPARMARQLTPEVVERAEELLAAGFGKSAVAKQLGIKADTLKKGIAAGRVRDQKKSPVGRKWRP
jgi:transposase-like protein